MATGETVPDPSVILDLLEAFRRSKTMFAAVSLGVFDALSAGSKTPHELSRELQVDVDALGRLLDACACLQLLRRDTLGYANTPVSETYLRSQSSRRLTGYINYSNDVMWKLWSHLDDAVREGTHRWRQAYGWDGPIFANFFHDEHSKREFLMGMHGFGLISSPCVVAAFDLSRFHRLVDLGGATGHLTMAACERYPGLSGVVFDLPDAMPLAREIIGKSSTANRLELVEGDFFVDELPPADLYAVGRILHDWTEAKIITLLTKVFASLPSGGAILIAEKLLEEDRSGPRWAHMQSLNMLTCTGGKERTLSEYESLLRQVGFVDVVGHATSSPLDAVMAYKPN